MARGANTSIQLDGRGCQAGPLSRLRALQRHAAESAVEVFLFGQHLIDDPRQLGGHDGARDYDRFAASLLLVERFDDRVVLNRPDTRVTEGKFEIAIARLGARAVAGAPARVVRAGYHAAVREELSFGGEPSDPIDFGPDREHVYLADPWHPQESLDIGIWDQVRMQDDLEVVDLLAEQGELGARHVDLMLIPGIEVVAGGDVVYFTDAFETVEAADPFFHQPYAQP